MPPKAKTVYVCNECGFETARWSGQCPSCGEWNCLHEEVRTKTTATRSSVTTAPLKLADIRDEDEPRLTTGMSELDRVLGGGIVPGGLMLLGGDPGIGKSTLLLQVCAHIGASRRILYVSGEESARQIRLRATRLGVDTDNLFVLCENDVETILAAVADTHPDLLIIDSI
ncbi:MAG: AAA family ATPase, partial [Clostridia bacterium]|nr:AAA family ATPase [Clostridia bacterium]